MIETATLLATLRTESVQYTEAEHTEAGPRHLVMLRPAGVGVRNDGYRGYWMLPGQTYRLAHDGTGWRVTCPDWTDGHVLRLVDAEDGRQIVDVLPGDEGSHRLEPGRVYELREQTPGVWGLFQA